MLHPWYCLNTALARELGKTLIHWSKNAHAYPEDKYSFEEWTSLLYLHGCILRRYGTEKILDRAWEKHGCFIASPDFHYLTETEVSEIEAKHSMQWITDNFYNLWD